MSHMVRHSLKFVPWKDRKTVAADLKEIYHAPKVELAEKALEAFSAKWDGKYPAISPSWRNNWANIIPLFAYCQWACKSLPILGMRSLPPLRNNAM